MSFSGTVKEELAAHVSSARHCQLAELAALLLYNGSTCEGVGYHMDSGQRNDTLKRGVVRQVNGAGGAL